MSAAKPRFADSHGDLPDPDQIAAMSGMAFMEAMLEGDIPHPPIARAMNLRLVGVAPGQAVFRGTPGFDHLNVLGTIHGGWYGALADSALGCAVMTRIPQGRTYTTVEYKVNVIRPIPPGMDVDAVAEADHVGRSTAVAHCRVVGVADGRLYATGSTTCLIMQTAG